MSNKEEYKKNKDNKEKTIREDLIEGRNSVSEALKSDRTIEYLLIAKGNVEGSIKKIIQVAKDKKIVIKEVEKRKLDSMSETGSHQGVMAIVTPFKYSEIDEIL